MLKALRRTTEETCLTITMYFLRLLIRTYFYGTPVTCGKVLCETSIWKIWPNGHFFFQQFIWYLFMHPLSLCNVLLFGLLSDEEKKRIKEDETLMWQQIWLNRKTLEQLRWLHVSLQYFKGCSESKHEHGLLNLTPLCNGQNFHIQFTTGKSALPFVLLIPMFCKQN